ARLLRAAGIGVPMLSVLTATRAVDVMGLERRSDVAAALRACLTTSTEEAAVHDAVFDVFWSADSVEMLPAAPSDDERGDGEDGRGVADANGAADELTAGAGSTGRRASRRATFSRTALAEASFIPAAARDRRVEDAAVRLAAALGSSPGRRTRSGPLGDRVDVRSSLRHNVRFGGELLELRRVQRLPDKARLVVLCDVSSSMLPYTPLFLAFAHALTRSTRSVEAAVFNVQTSFVTDVFRRQSLAASMRWLQAHSVTLAGGTMTGECLRTFTSSLVSRGMLRRTTTAVLLSDGWDGGDTRLLREQALRLRHHVGRLVWLDPHAAETGYQPQVSGLRAVWPAIDDYLDFAGVKSLAGLVDRLALPQPRPAPLEEESA
ncbi:MAG: vWA domain-containing protein, partial [Nocardioidaceae bacterium]